MFCVTSQYLSGKCNICDILANGSMSRSIWRSLPGYSFPNKSLVIYHHGLTPVDLVHQPLLPIKTTIQMPWSWHKMLALECSVFLCTCKLGDILRVPSGCHFSLPKSPLPSSANLPWLSMGEQVCGGVQGGRWPAQYAAAPGSYQSLQHRLQAHLGWLIKRSYSQWHHTKQSCWKLLTQFSAICQDVPTGKELITRNGAYRPEHKHWVFGGSVRYPNH